MLRRLVAPLTVVALGLTACGGGEDGDAATSAEPAGVLSADRLDDALLEPGSTVGEAEVRTEDIPGFADDRQAAPDSCQPLSAVLGLAPDPVHSGRVQAATPDLGPWVDVQLLSYAGDDAETVFGMVDEAVDACASGFDETHLREYRITEVVRGTAPKVGDQALAYTLRSVEVPDSEGSQSEAPTVLVRDGNQLLFLRAGSTSSDQDQARALLAAVLDAQWQRYADRTA
jgi:hypothetical protein